MSTNLPVTSREYKLMLRTDHFRERERGAAAYWNLVEFLIRERQGNEIYKKQDRQLRRVTSYLDTPGTELRKHGYVVRAREEYDKHGEFDGYKITLKFRSPDRYIAAAKDMSCSDAIDDCDDKFEEDILPPFNSKFARSVSFRTGEMPTLDNIGQVQDLFPGLEALPIPASTPINVVNGFRAHEISYRVGQLQFVRMPLSFGDKPDFLVKCCLNFWYLLADDEWPLTAEFSFDYDLPDRGPGQADQLEYYSPEVVAGSNAFFQALQRQVGWLDRTGTTKTAYAFSAL